MAIHKNIIFSKFSLTLLAGILLLLAALIAHFVKNLLDEDLTRTRNNAQQQFASIASIISTEMSAEQYQNINPLFRQWSDSDVAIMEMKLTAANGFNIANFHRSRADRHFFDLEYPIRFSYHDEAKLAVRVGLDSVYEQNKKISIEVAGLFLFFSALLAFILFMAVQLQREAARSKFLADLNKALSEINQAIVRMDQQADIFPLICRCAVEFGGMSAAWVGQLDQDGERIIPVASVEKNHSGSRENKVRQSAAMAGMELAGAAMKKNIPVIVNNYFAATIQSGSLHDTARLPYKSAAAFPISKHGLQYAVLQVFHSDSASFQSEVIALLGEMTRDVSFALENFDRKSQLIKADQARKLTASVYAASNEAIMIIDAGNQIVSVNAAFTRMTGYQESEIFGSNPVALSADLNENTLLNLNWNELDTAKLRGSEIAVRRKNGDTYPALIFFSAVTDNDGNITHYVASHIDITERKNAEALLRKMNNELEERVAGRTRDLANANATLQQAHTELKRTQEELIQREKMAALGVLIAGVSHEMNTPIGNSLTVGSSMRDEVANFEAALETGKITRSRLNEFNQHIHHGLDILLRNLSRAIDQLAHFKQVSVDQVSEHRRSFELKAIVADNVSILEPQFKRTPHHIVVDIPAACDMDSYPGSIGQIITNLVINAQIHGFSDNMRGEVLIAARMQDESHVRLIISDNGKGIPANNLDRVFDPFFTTRMGQGGSGLGLNIVFNLVTSTLGGNIQVDSEVGKFTRFTMVLPVVAPQD